MRKIIECRGMMQSIAMWARDSGRSRHSIRYRLDCGMTAEEAIFGKNKNPHERHGMCRSREYRIWTGMVDRCNRPKNRVFRYYGGKGIRVCEKWMSFQGFYADMGACPEGCSIDRINSNGNYEPANCRWATQKQQMRNQGRNRNFNIDGEVKCLAEWCEKYQISEDVVYQRLLLGWGIEKALTSPVVCKPKNKKVFFNGGWYTAKDLSKEYRLSYNLVRERLFRNGWTTERTITTPPRKTKCQTA